MYYAADKYNLIELGINQKKKCGNNASEEGRKARRRNAPRILRGMFEREYEHRRSERERTDKKKRKQHEAK